MAVIDLNEDTFDAAIAGATTPVIVDFWAPWCGPCRRLSPVLEQIASAHEGRLVVAKVNVDDNPQLAARFGVQSIPSVARLDAGRMSAHTVGAAPADQLLAALGLD